MPPRSVTLAIVAFWLGTTGWLAYHDLWPRLRSAEPPPFTIDLTDEVSVGDVTGLRGPGAQFTARAIAWSIKLRGKNIGYAKTWVQRHEDRTFEMLAELRFDPKLEVGPLEVKRLTSSYHVTSSGELLGLGVRGRLKDPSGLLRAFVESLGVVTMKDTEVEVGIEGDVKDGLFKPRALFYDTDPTKPPAQALLKKELPEAFLKLHPVPISEGGTVLNTMQPLHRLVGLREGQTWRVPRIDPLEAVLATLNLGGAPRTRYLDAHVSADTLSWDRRDEPCWRIDYDEPGRPDAARTWVRRRDGLVLQQEARHEGTEMVLRRDPRR
jgi:hypothetical protein